MKASRGRTTGPGQSVLGCKGHWPANRSDGVHERLTAHRPGDWARTTLARVVREELEDNGRRPAFHPLRHGNLGAGSARGGVCIPATALPIALISALEFFGLRNLDIGRLSDSSFARSTAFQATSCAYGLRQA